MDRYGELPGQVLLDALLELLQRLVRASRPRLRRWTPGTASARWPCRRASGRMRQRPPAWSSSFRKHCHPSVLILGYSAFRLYAHRKLSDAFDLGIDTIADRQERTLRNTHPGRRAGEQHVARVQCHDARGSGDLLRDREIMSCRRARPASSRRSPRAVDRHSGVANGGGTRRGPRGNRYRSLFPQPIELVEGFGRPIMVPRREIDRHRPACHVVHRRLDVRRCERACRSRRQVRPPSRTSRYRSACGRCRPHRQLRCAAAS